MLVDEKNVLIAGHGRLVAAGILGLEMIPAIQISGLSDAERRALMLADNKIAENAGWDFEMLASELADLSATELKFDLEVTGFDVAEMDLIIDAGPKNNIQDPDEPPCQAVQSVPVSRLGDLWQLGRHWLICGDAKSSEVYAALMRGDLAHGMFTDAPYNVRVNGHVTGMGRTRHREFAEASGEMSDSEYQAFLDHTLGLAARHCRDGAIAFSCIDWRHVSAMETAGLRSFGAVLNLCIWSKNNAGMGSLYRSQHELIFVFRKGRAVHRNNVQLGRYGRNRSNVWHYPGANAFSAGRKNELENHPTPKPVAMIRDALLDVTARSDIVLDPFMGAGATLIAAERCGRVACGIEIDPLYVDVTLRRWRVETGQEPVRVSDGRTFAEAEAHTMTSEVV